MTGPASGVNTLYVENLLAGTFQGLQTNDSAPAAATTGTGWTVAKTASPDYSWLAPNVKQVAGTFGTTVLPTASVPGNASAGNAFRTRQAWNGTFANANWTFTWTLRAVTSASTQAGRLQVRVYRGTDPTGTGATEITSAVQGASSTAATAFSTTVDSTNTYTWAPGGTLTLTNEYLFFTAAWSITVAGGTTTADVLVRSGSSTIATSSFTPSTLPAGTATFDLPPRGPTPRSDFTHLVWYTYAASAVTTAGQSLSDLPPRALPRPNIAQDGVDAGLALSIVDLPPGQGTLDTRLPPLGTLSRHASRAQDGIDSGLALGVVNQPLGNQSVDLPVAYGTYITGRQNLIACTGQNNLTSLWIEPAGPSLNTLFDNFNDGTIDATKWQVGEFDGSQDVSVTVTESGGVLSIQPLSGTSGSHYNGILSTNVYDITNAGAFVQVVQRSTSSGGTAPDTSLVIAFSPTVFLRWREFNGFLACQYTPGDGVIHTLQSLSWNATFFAWWRIRVSGGFIIWDTSKDGGTWTLRANLPLSSFNADYTRVNPQLQSGTSASSTAPTAAIFDNFNFLPIPIGTQGLGPDDLPTRAPARAVDYTVGSGLALFDAATAVGLPPGDTTCAAHALVPAGPSRREYGQAASSPLSLIAQDQFNAGTQSYDLLPRGPSRAVDYTWVRSFPLELIGQDALTTGEQSVDLPPRAPLRAGDYTWLWSYTLELIGQDSLPVGSSTLDTRLPPLSSTSRVPANAQDGIDSGLALFTIVTLPPGETTLATVLPPYGPRQSNDFTFSIWYSYTATAVVTPAQVVLDLPPYGTLLAPDYTWIYSALNVLNGITVPNGEVSVELPPRGSQRAPDYTWIQQFALDVYAEEPHGADTALTELPARGPARARDYSFSISFTPELIGQDAFNAGDQFTELPPRGPVRAREYGQATSFPLELIGQDQLPTGEQHVELSPIGPTRSRDYTWLQQFGLDVYEEEPHGQSTQLTELPPRASSRARDYTWTQSLLPVLSGKDQFNAGTQLSGNAPAALPRSRDYTFIASFPLELIAQDTFNPGKQVVELPPIAPPRAREYTWITAYNLGTSPVGQSTETTVLWPRKSARLADYTWIQGPLPVLYGQDAFNPGKISIDLTPKTAPRATDYTWIQTFELETLGPEQQFPVGELPQQDLTPNATPRARDYSFTSWYFQGLIGKDTLPSGAQLSGNAPPASARARDYTWVQIFELETLGPLQQFPIGSITTDLAPRNTARLIDYTWTASFFGGLSGQDALATGDQLSGNAPPAPRRAIDYTFTQSFPLELIAQDQFTTGAQELDHQYRVAPRTLAIYDPGINGALNLSVQLPIGQNVLDQQYRIVPRSRDYTYTAWYFQGLIAQDQFTAGDQLSGNAPARPLRSTEYTWLQPILAGTLQASQPNPGQSTELTTLPPRAASRAIDYTWLYPTALELLSKDTFFGVGGPAYDYPNPSFALRIRQTYVATSATNFGQNIGVLPLLSGKDAFNAGEQTYELPPRKAAQAVDYTFVNTFPLVLIGQDQRNPGAQLFDLAPRSATRSIDYSWSQQFSLDVFGQVAIGQSTERTVLPPRAATRSTDYTWVNIYPLVLIAQDAFTTGDQFTELPPRTATRSVDYSWTQNFGLDIYGREPAGGSTSFTELPSRPPLRSVDYTYTFSFPLELIARDQFTPGAQSVELPLRTPVRTSTLHDFPPFSTTLWASSQLPVGAITLDSQYRTTIRRFSEEIQQHRQSSAQQPPIPRGQSTALTALAPLSAPRSRDYTWLWAYTLELIGQDALPVGQNTSVIPINGIRREYTWIQTFSLLTQPIGQSIVPDELRSPARLNDYTWIHIFDINTLGPSQQFPVGQATTEIPFRTPRSIDYTCLQTQVATFATPPGTQAGTQATELPIRIARHEATWLQSFALNVYAELPDGQGNQPQPIVVPRSIDYTWTQRFELSVNLIQPIGNQFFELPPRPESRSVDYTWLQTFSNGPLDQAPLGQSTQITELSPRSPYRLRDYTWITTFPPVLIGQDTRAIGIQSVDLPIPPQARALDYTWLTTFSQDERQAFGTPLNQRNTVLTELPPYAPARSRDYTWIEIGFVANQHPPLPQGIQVFDLSPRATPRALDYTWTATFGIRARQFRVTRVIGQAGTITSTTGFQIVDTNDVRDALPNTQTFGGNVQDNTATTTPLSDERTSSP